jgi:hypothetical protein
MELTALNGNFRLALELAQFQDTLVYKLVRGRNCLCMSAIDARPSLAQNAAVWVVGFVYIRNYLGLLTTAHLLGELWINWSSGMAGWRMLFCGWTSIAFIAMQYYFLVLIVRGLWGLMHPSSDLGMRKDSGRPMENALGEVVERS